MSVFKDFPGLENLKNNSKTFKDFQRPARALDITGIFWSTIRKI